jgi:hypothetical protein
LVVFVEGKETVRKKCGNSLLDFGGVGMDEAGAEGITSGLKLCRRLAGAELKEGSAGAADNYPEQKDYSEWTENFHKESLHGPMILQ